MLLDKTNDCSLATMPVPRCLYFTAVCPLSQPRSFIAHPCSSLVVLFGTSDALR
jgi:hypothetical protein